jgi:hypothetical protein
MSDVAGVEPTSCWQAIQAYSELGDAVMSQLCRQCAIAICRAMPEQNLSAPAIRALDMAERFAQGVASYDDLMLARQMARQSARAKCPRNGMPGAACLACRAVLAACGNDAVLALCDVERFVGQACLIPLPRRIAICREVCAKLISE